MKIAILAPANNVHTKKWLDYYNEKGYETINISFESHKDSEDRSKWKNVTTHYLKLKLNNKLAYFLTVPELKSVLKKVKPDLLHSHYISSYGVVGAMANYHPYVSSVWGSDIYDFPKEGSINAAMVRFALKKSDVICSTSFVMKKETELYTSKPIEVTPFGVDMNRFKPVQKSVNDKLSFGIVKTMAEKYGIRYLIEGYAKYKSMVSPEDYSKTDLHIVGGGPMLDEYKKLSEELGVSDQTIFHGKIPHHEVPAMINSFDVFFVPSTLDSESFGVAAVEAQACEVPVVVSNVGGLPEVVLDGETGFVIETKNSQAIADKMLAFTQQPDLKISMGKKGREHVLSLYEWNDNADIMSGIYETILKKR